MIYVSINYKTLGHMEDESPYGDPAIDKHHTKNPVKEAMESIASMGRSFRLGALYDMNSDKIIPGGSLWTWKKLKEKKRVKHFHTVETQIITDDSLFSKMKFFNIKFDLTVSSESSITLKNHRHWGNVHVQR